MAVTSLWSIPYHDVWRTVDVLGRIVEEGQYERYPNERGVVA